MARSSAGRPNADKPGPDAESPDSTDAPDPDFDATDAAGVDGADADAPETGFDVEGEIERTPQIDAFWDKIKVEPIEIALPGGVGYTLRAYRMSTEITPSDYTAREADEFPDRAATYAGADDVDEIDDEFDDEFDELDDEDLDEDELAADEIDAGEADLDEDDEEEIPIFLSKGGNLLVFRTRAGLVDFVKSDAEHDLTQLKGWSKFVRQVRPEHVVPTDEDSYELDLVVKNLRAGHATWDPDLVVQSGQIARDLGHALRIESVVLAMAPGSPLDDLDEALRDVADGGMGTFFARRKMKKIGAETASIGWRTVIGKISTVVDWRD